MKLHYLYSNRQAVKRATIRFNGEIQKDAQYVDDEAQTITRRKYNQAGLIMGTETLSGRIEIELPAGVPGGPYKTKEI